MSCYPIGNIPREIALEIFGFLPQEDLVQSSRVSKEWNRVANEALRVNFFDPKKEFPTIKVIDEEVWKRCADLDTLGLDATVARLLDKRRDMPALKQLITSLDIEGDAGITLLTIPEGLTLNKLVVLATFPKQGNPINFSCTWPQIFKDLGDIPIPKTYQVAITNSVLKKSRNLSIEKQREIAAQNGCEMPSLVEAVALIFLTCLNSPKESPIRLYNDLTFTRVTERSNEMSLVVGGFIPTGLSIFCNRGELESNGVGAVRKF